MRTRADARGGRLTFLSTTSRSGTARTGRSPGLWIEALHPADAATAEALRS